MVSTLDVNCAGLILAGPIKPRETRKVRTEIKNATSKRGLGSARRKQDREESKQGKQQRNPEQAHRLPPAKAKDKDDKQRSSQNPGGVITNTSRLYCRSSEPQPRTIRARAVHQRDVDQRFIHAMPQHQPGNAFRGSRQQPSRVRPRNIYLQPAYREDRRCFSTTRPSAGRAT
jgi:hypothetical protein